MNARQEMEIVASGNGEFNPEPREQFIVDRIIPIDINKEEGLRKILEMFQDPANREHLAGITPRTTMFDLRDYYRETNRHGFVGISKTEGLVGVYDLQGPKKVPGKRGSEDVELTVGFLNRLCVRTDLQRRQIGPQLVKDAIRKAHNEYKWSNLLAAIVLNKESSDTIQRARNSEDLDEPAKDQAFREVLENLKLLDARVKLFVVKYGFENAGFHPNVTVGGEPREVLMISHPQPNLTPPQ